MTQGIKKTNSQIHHDVLEELKWDSRVDEAAIELLGYLPCGGAKRAWG